MDTRTFNIKMSETDEPAHAAVRAHRSPHGKHPSGKEIPTSVIGMGIVFITVFHLIKSQEALQQHQLFYSFHLKSD